MRFDGSGRGIKSARAAHWRNLSPKSAVSGSSSADQLLGFVRGQAVEQVERGLVHLGKANQQSPITMQA